MATFPSTTSARASYQRVAGRPAPSISWTRQVNLEPSGADQCGSMRVASQIRPAATASNSTAQNTVPMTGQHRLRHRSAAVGVAAIGLVVALAACSSGGSKAAPTTVATSPPVPSTATTVVPTTTTLPTGPADLGTPTVEAAQATSALGVGDLDPSIRDQVALAVHTYLNAATGTPLGSGSPAVLDGVLTSGAAARLTAPTRDALADEGLPALAAVKADHAVVSLDAFMGPDLSMIVNASLDLQVSASTPAGSPVTIVRRGMLTFVDDGGTWKIDAFDLAVARDIP
jgi:hypothetical protein